MFKYLNPSAKEDDVGNHPLSYFKNSYEALQEATNKSDQNQ